MQLCQSYEAIQSEIVQYWWRISFIEIYEILCWKRITNTIFVHYRLLLPYWPIAVYSRVITITLLIKPFCPDDPLISIKSFFSHTLSEIYTLTVLMTHLLSNKVHYHHPLRESLKPLSRNDLFLSINGHYYLPISNPFLSINCHYHHYIQKLMKPLGRNDQSSQLVISAMLYLIHQNFSVILQYIPVILSSFLFTVPGQNPARTPVILSSHHGLQPH